jgi:DNA primase catalytic subunit
MTPQEQERLEACITEIAQILYNNTPTEKITFEEISSADSRREILDWYHLRENLYKVGGSLKRLKQAEEKLWHGQVDDAIACFSNCHRKQAHNFCAYLTKHRHRLVNYQHFQEQRLSSIGSGAVESAVKQIDRRLKISGSQWKLENVSRILQLRCAYLNGLLAV